ncbi:MAG: Gfo/Idh/MocA family oxidoreductase [Anaerolineae bacterium]
MSKKRYAQIGLGSRSMMYTHAIVDQFADSSELVALCDSNEGRLRLRADWVRERGIEVPTYTADQFERMIRETKPDIVIVTTVDHTHDEYICRAMELGCDVITEKPMTTDEHKCQRILDTQRATGRSVRVTFNYRYSAPRTQIKELLMSGVIGNVVSVDFHWLLDTRHGADYFRRWHRNKVNSGGLLVHKATHHFDLVNWWLSTVPEQVFAEGRRNFYRPETAERYGLHQRAERCLDCPEAGRCPFYLDLRAYPQLKELYLDNESYDGYHRDGCVFSETIDIEDTMHVVVNYRSGATMSYSLHAFMPWEGYIVSFNGTRGRLEHICQETVYFSGDGSVPGELLPQGTKIHIYPHFRSGYEVEVWQSKGGHGGGDPVLLTDLFSPQPPEDKYLRAADHRAGAWSILTGVAANRSIEWGRPVRIDELIHDLDEPDYPPMPSANEPLPLPQAVESMPEWFKKAKDS